MGSHGSRKPERHGDEAGAGDQDREDDAVGLVVGPHACERFLKRRDSTKALMAFAELRTGPPGTRPAR